MKRLTYYTPTFNRAHLLPNLYNSLKLQSNKNFVWLVVDDGSTDNTKELCEKWQNENEIEINYIYKENGGKHTAMDLAHSIIATEYSACIDSDDFLDTQATELILEEIKKCDIPTCAGIVGQKIRLSHPILHKCWSEFASKQVCFYDFYEHMGAYRETILVFKNNIVKKFHFPVFSGERFVTESVLYQQFLFDYTLLVTDKKLYYSEYKDDGLTCQAINLFLKNPQGFMYSIKQNAECAIKYKRLLKYRVYYVAKFYCWKKFLKDKTNKLQIPFIYKLLGKLGMLLIYWQKKKEYKNFLKTKKEAVNT